MAKKRSASGRPTAGKPGQFKYGSPEWQDAMERKRRERVKRGYVGRTIGGSYKTAGGSSSRMRSSKRGRQ
jgi:hypothetical protein